MRRTWVYIDGVAYEKGVDPMPDRVQIMREIEPYISQIDGSLITSRAKHQEHLRRHGYTEVGNDSSIFKPPAPISAKSTTRKELLIAQVNAMTHEEFKAAGKRDLDHLRWQTNGIPDPLKEI